MNGNYSVKMAHVHIIFSVILLLFIFPGVTHAHEQVVVGVATSLSLLEGEESLKAVMLAAEEINGKGGVVVGDKRLPIKVKSIDLNDASLKVPVSHALSQMKQFIRKEEIDAILVGPFRSEVLLAGMDMIAQLKLPVLGTIAMSTASETKIMKDPKYRYIFRVGLNSKYFVEYLIKAMKFLNGKFGFNRVFIMNQDVAWSRAAASLLIKLYFERAGWEVIDLDTYPTGASDFSIGLNKATREGAQVILPIFDMPQSGFLVRQWNRMKVPAILCGFISPMVGPSAWETFNGKIAGALNVIFELGNVPSTKFKPAMDFYEAYRKRYGENIEAGHGPAPAYESVYILAEAIARAGSLDPDKMVMALQETDRMGGAMGRIRFHRGQQAIFGDNPDTEALACIVQWTKTGRRKIVYPPAIAEGDIELPRFPP
jgi:branched-chain amino acid transport system substrate-binding protein